MRLLSFIFCTAALFGCSDRPQQDPIHPIRKVSVEVAKEDSNPEVDTYTGIVAFLTETTHSFSSAGRIAKVFVREGETFGRGAVLASLDTSTVKAALDSAQANFEQATQQLDRREQLFARGWVTKADLESARAQFTAAKAQVDTQRFHVDNAVIVARNPGVVLDRIAEPAQNVAAAEPVLRTGNLNQRLVLRVPLPQKVAARVQVGTAGEVVLPSAQNARLGAVLVEISPQSEEVSGTFTALFALSGATPSQVGQIGEIRLRLLREPEARIVLPLSAIFDVRGDEGFVYVIDRQNRAIARRVVLGDITENGVAVKRGIARGERVAASGLDWLENGMQVAPIAGRP
jgi:RND family efflux transporter MFP subunit